MVTMFIATTRTTSQHSFNTNMNANEIMDDYSAKEETTEPEESNTSEIKTSDVYKVDKNLPSRFNNPECFRYSHRTINPLYQTTNQTYGSKKPTVHEMPTSFNGSRHRFSEHLLKNGMYRDNGFNTMLDKSRLSRPNETSVFYDRINFHSLYHTAGKS